MNILKLLCSKCQDNSEKDILLSINNKDSRNSIRLSKTKNIHTEIISNNSTNNLEVIDYPYITNSKESLSKITNKNILLRLKLDKRNIELEKINNKNYDSLDSENNSSIVMINENSYRQNKDLLEKFTMEKNKKDKKIDNRNNQKIIENLLYSSKTTEMSNCNVEKVLNVNKNSLMKKTNQNKKVNQNKNLKKNKCPINKNKKNINLENNLKNKFNLTTNSKIDLNKNKRFNNKSFNGNQKLIKDYKQISLNNKTYETTLTTNLKKYKSNASRVVKNKSNKLNYSYLLLNNNSSKNYISH